MSLTSSAAPIPPQVMDANTYVEAETSQGLAFLLPKTGQGAELRHLLLRLRSFGDDGPRATERSRGKKGLLGCETLRRASPSFRRPAHNAPFPATLSSSKVTFDIPLGPKQPETTCAHRLGGHWNAATRCPAQSATRILGTLARRPHHSHARSHPSQTQIRTFVACGCHPWSAASPAAQAQALHRGGQVTTRFKTPPELVPPPHTLRASPSLPPIPHAPILAFHSPLPHNAPLGPVHTPHSRARESDAQRFRLLRRRPKGRSRWAQARRHT